MNRSSTVALSAVLVLLLAACGTSPEAEPDASAADAAHRSDAGRDAGQPGLDAGPADSGTEEERTCMRATLTATAPTHLLVDDTAQASVTLENPESCTRRYSLLTNAALRDNLPASPRRFSERAGQPTVRTGNDLFDALYALALEEVRENSVTSINDGAFDEGRPVPCPTGGCFETGRNWHYVWTRDTAYSVDLALGALDPQRSRNSLEFKLSERRGGGGLQIVQDTGTGGAYPVSTDRVTWALGARELLKYLDGAERLAFRDRAAEALRNTLAHDRDVAFDPADGLYRGEQSFLDWREQSYPRWTIEDLVQIGRSKALSTNLAHLGAIEFAAELADERADEMSRILYEGWAGSLRTAIDDRFWLPDQRLFSTFTAGELDPSAVHRYDLLGSALAVLFQIGGPERATEVLAHYPHAGKGPAVLWPQQQDTAIYHNRSIWPFVTAYWLRAARQAGNDAVVDFGVHSLMRGAALNLSNMENLELVTGKSFLEEGPTSGPVVNSQRQLWSVAGYLSMVHDVVFGLETSRNGIRFRPFVTRELRDTLFANADTLVLNHFPFRGRRLTVVVKLPAKDPSGSGALEVASVKVDGRPATTDFLAVAELAPASIIEITLVASAVPAPPASMTTVVDTAEYRNLFGPRTPIITAVSEVDGKLRLTLDRGGETADDVLFDLFRDGIQIATGLPGGTETWIDPDSSGRRTRTYCYSAATRFVKSDNASQHARPVCWWGRGGDRVRTVGAWDLKNTGGQAVLGHGRYHVGSWGAPGDSLELPRLRPDFTGDHLLQIVYGNGSGPINTGITCAVKRLVVEELPAGPVVSSEPVLMPQLGDWSQWRDSSSVRVTLDASKEYRIRLVEDDHSVNMSVFSHFALYTSGPGGRDGAYNRVNVAGLKVLALTGLPATTGDKVILQGQGDYDRFAATNQLVPGIPFDSQDPMDRFALDWDADYLYVAIVSKGFETPNLPYLLYLQTATETRPLPAAQTRAGIEYGGQLATVPFQANYAIAVRRESQFGDDGPWNGLFANAGNGWERRQRFDAGRDLFVGADQGHTLSFRIPRAQLGHPTRLRLSGHLVAGSGNYKDVIPSATPGPEHQPWLEGRTQGFFEIELGAQTATSEWEIK